MNSSPAVAASPPSTSSGSSRKPRSVQQDAVGKSLLITDDEPYICDNLARFFRTRGYEVVTANDGATALRTAKGRSFDCVLLDLRLPDMSGIEVLRTLKREYPSTGVVLFTAYGDVGTAVHAMREKADNFLLKPVDLGSLLAVVKRVIENYRSMEEVVYLRDRLSNLRGSSHIDNLEFPPSVARGIQLLAENPATNVLILGETGSGKGVVANAIHELSDRSGRQLVDINCAGLSAELLESELFGHERGAFTDAKTFKRGLLEIADGGSLFLDEVAELTLPVQAKLLKVIEDRHFRRLGGTTNINVDVRIMAATHHDLEKLARAGEFRADLFFRLNVVPIRLPPLRKRRGQIMALANRFLAEYATLFSKRLARFSPEAENMLTMYRWPGNIRELRNVIERAALLADGDEILPAHLPENLRTRPHFAVATDDDDQTLAGIEARHIERVLRSCEGNRTRAAEILGIHRVTLIRKIRKLGIEL